MSDYFEDIVEIDNFISPRYAEHLKQTVMDSKFPWYFNRDITSPLWFWEQNHLNDSTLDVEESSFTGFMHILWGREGKESDFYDIFVPLLYSMEEKINMTIAELVQLRLGLFTLNKNRQPYHVPHVDYQDDGLKYTAIYYLNDSDGDTYFFNEFLDPNIKRFINGYDPSLFTVAKSVKPKQGKLVLFDGRRYHASSYPESTPERMVLNINFAPV
nr:Prolyl 4-hydroxylase alpha subunit homologue [uncultured Mediterranean phage uvMED]BAR27665.1 Prolyl 4-hydroxylase alpha subunit homologue [uncultured Mediterranean phage uvMED]|tara:strand:- start:3056 stop:3697 length:642 start_codon:yes stop_codon:yes gene_type:complete